MAPDIVSDSAGSGKWQDDSEEEGEASDAVFLLEIFFEARAWMYVACLIEFVSALAGRQGDLAEAAVGPVFFNALVFANG